MTKKSRKLACMRGDAMLSGLLNRTLIKGIILLLLLPAQITLPAQSPDSVLRIMKKVADWQLHNWETSGMKYGPDNWVYGAAYTGFMALNEVANDKEYTAAMFRIGSALGWNTGADRTMADDYCVGQMYAQMYSLFKEPVMIAHFRALADSIMAMPHTESLAWKNNIALREWAWCDALFMGPTALAYLSTATGERQYLDIADKLWWKTTDYLFDKEESLYYRDSSFFTKTEANGKKVFWSRGNGWVLAGLVRVLTNMPANYPTHDRYIGLYQKMASKIKSLQQDDGTWHTSLLDPGNYPVKETSGTGFYCYALAWGVNTGLLPYHEYYPVIEKAWAALSGCVHEDGKLGFVQRIGDRPGATDYNSTESYAVGAFLLAGSQMIDLKINHLDGSTVLEISNAGPYDRTQEITQIPIALINEKNKHPDTKKIRITDLLTGKEIAYQWEYRGNPTPVSLLVQIDAAPGSKICLGMREGDPMIFVQKTYCRFVPERKDDFAWENDKIAHRMYGKAIEGSSEDASGVDVWVKRTTRLIINERYRRGEYHIDHGDGMDYYHVGHSLGAGNVMPFVRDSIWYSKNFHAYKILDNGPLRSTFQLIYDAWDVNGRQVRAVKTISTDAGSQLDKFEADYEYADTAELPLVIGIVKREQPGEELLDEKNDFMAYWEPRMGDDGITGVASILLQPAQKMRMDDHHLLALTGTKNKSIVYYTGACWNKAGEITSADQWFSYVRNFYGRLQEPLQVNVKRRPGG
jgi:unsaturated rhamnogalacturonyl hydrolase